MAKTWDKAPLSSRLAPVLVLIAAALWGSNGIFVKVLNTAGLNGTQITAVRMCSVPVLCLVILLATDPSQLSIRPADWKWFMLNGIAGTFCFTLLYTFSIEWTGMATAAVLIYLMPSLVMLFSVLFLGEHFTLRKGLCLVLSLLACGLVSGLAEGLSLRWNGLLAGLGSAGCYAVYNILIATKLRQYNPLTIVFYSGLIAAVPSVLYAALTGDLPGIGAVFAARPDALVLNVLLAVFCSVLPYGLYNTAVKTMAASKASILATFEPIAAALFGLVLFQEAVTSAGWLGIVCEVAALVLLQLPEKQHAS